MPAHRYIDTLKITPDPQEARKDFRIPAGKIGSLSAQGIADYSPDTGGYIPRDESKRLLLLRFATRSPFTRDVME